LLRGKDAKTVPDMIISNQYDKSIQLKRMGLMRYDVLPSFVQVFSNFTEQSYRTRISFNGMEPTAEIRK